MKVPAVDSRPPRVGVRAAHSADRRLLEGLLQFYIYDFSEMQPADSPDFEFNPRGGFEPFSDLDDYWRREGFHPLIIAVDERPAGFALINTHSHRGGAVERNIGEFFVARKYRRRGVATLAVHQILARLPGRWEVAVAARNAAALRFWPAAISAAPNVTALTRREGDGEQWRGPIWCFNAA